MIDLDVVRQLKLNCHKYSLEIWSANSIEAVGLFEAINDWDALVDGVEEKWFNNSFFSDEERLKLQSFSKSFNEAADATDEDTFDFHQLQKDPKWSKILLEANELHMLLGKNLPEHQ